MKCKLDLNVAMGMKQEPQDAIDYKIDFEEHFYRNEDVRNNHTINAVKNEFVSIKREEEVDLGTDHSEQIFIGSKSRIDQVVVGDASNTFDFIKIEDFKQSEKGGKFNIKQEVEETNSFDDFNMDLKNEFDQGSKEESRETESCTFSFESIDNLHQCMSEFVGKDQETDTGENSLENTQEKPFKCDTCSKSFLQKGHFNRHLRCHTGEKPFTCNICFKCFSDRYLLKIHSRTHTGEKPFECEICSKSFSHRTHLKEHFRIHSGEKPFKCEICQKSFIVRSTLNKHTRLHTGEKPFRCEICSKCFSQNNALKRHLPIHTGEKQFQCEVCSKYFSQKGTLNRHLRTHTGEKWFRCELCSKSFSQKSTLNRHLRVHSQEKPFNCEICFECFPDKSELEQHSCSHTHNETLY